MKTTSRKTLLALLTLAMVLSLPIPMYTQASEAVGEAGSRPFSAIKTRANTDDDPLSGIYVSPDGNDSTAGGSIEAPYKSINAALDAASPGSTVILRGGTYREGVNVRIRMPNITIKSAKGEWAVVDLTVSDPGHGEDSGIYFDVDSSGGKLQGVEVMGGFYAVCLETRWDWGDPADRGGASDITIEDCILHDSRYDVIKIKPNCNNVTIRNNEIYNSGIAYGGGSGNAEGIDNVNGANMTVQNNYIHDICSNAVYAKGGAADALIENNRIERAGEAAILAGFDTSPEFFNAETNPKYYESIRCTVRNNLVIDTGLSGIGLYAAIDAQIYNNTLVNVANSGQYHSAIYFGITFQDWEPYAGRPASVNPSIHNNIVSQPSGNVRPMVEIRYANELGGLSALDGSPAMSNNCYYVAGKSATFVDRRPRNELDNAGLAEWQSHIGSDSGSIEADPALDDDYLPQNPLCAGMGIGSPVDARQPETQLPFSDVLPSDWFYGSVKVAWEMGLVSGTTATTYAPDSEMLYSEAVKLAACMHEYHAKGSVTLENAEPLWYTSYVDYAIACGIISDGAGYDWSAKATRAGYMAIFANALPDEALQEINAIGDGAIPDVPMSHPQSEAIYTLYRAGIVQGVDDERNCSPEDNILRREVAAIITRMMNPGERIGVIEN